MPLQLLAVILPVTNEHFHPDNVTARTHVQLTRVNLGALQGSKKRQDPKQILLVNNYKATASTQKRMLSPQNQTKEKHQRRNYISKLLSWFPVPPQKVVTTVDCWVIVKHQSSPQTQLVPE